MTGIDFNQDFFFLSPKTYYFFSHILYQEPKSNENKI